MSDFTLHPIYPGAWCVPSAIQCLTGADYESVIHPALNRHDHNHSLTSLIVGASMSAATATLIEMGYDVRRYRHQDVHRLSTWARKSVEKYAGRALLVCTKGTPHALVIKDGRVYDTFTPHGERVSVHPFAKDIVNWCALIERKK